MHACHSSHTNSIHYICLFFLSPLTSSHQWTMRAVLWTTKSFLSKITCVHTSRCLNITQFIYILTQVWAAYKWEGKMIHSCSIHHSLHFGTEQLQQHNHFRILCFAAIYALCLIIHNNNLGVNIRNIRSTFNSVVAIIHKCTHFSTNQTSNTSSSINFLVKCLTRRISYAYHVIKSRICRRANL